LISKGASTGNVYIHADGSTNYFVALTNNISPTITDTAINNSQSLSFVARPDYTSVDFAPSSGPTVTQAHEIEKLVFYDSTGNTVLNTYTTSEFNSNPNGIPNGSTSTGSTAGAAQNNWPAGGGLLGLGLVFLIVGLVSRKSQPALNVTPPGYGQPQPPYGMPQQPYNPYGPPQQPNNPYGVPQQPNNPYGVPQQPPVSPQSQGQPVPPTQYAPSPFQPPAYGQQSQIEPTQYTPPPYGQ
jgi:hypothetical protein